MSYITASTSVVLVATGSATTSSIVYFPNISSVGRIITVRDNDGAASIQNPILLSTLQPSEFVGTTNPIQITQPYGFVTLTSQPNGTYTILNTFAFPPGQTVAYVSNVVASTISVQNTINFRDLANDATNILYTSSAQLILNNTILGTLTATNLQSTVAGLGSAGYLSSLSQPTQSLRLTAVGQTSNTVVNIKDPFGTRIFTDNNSAWQVGAVNSVVGFSNGGTAIAFGNNLFVAAGNNDSGAGAGSPNLGYLQWSEDGSFWNNSLSPQLSNTQVRTQVAYGNGLWVAVGSNTGGGAATIVYSGDGKNWSNANTSNIFQGGFATGVVYGKGVWVVSGAAGLLGSASSLLWSSNGSNWNPATSVSWGASTTWDVTFTGSNFVAIVDGPAPNIAVSADGKNWSITGVTGASLNAAARYLAYGNGVTLVASSAAAGAGQLLKYSLDGGYTWNSNTDFTTGTLYRPYFDSITWWVGVNTGTNTQAIYYSFTGSNGWTNQTIVGGFSNGGYPVAFSATANYVNPTFQLQSTVSGLQQVLLTSTIQTNTLSTGQLNVANLVVPNFTTGNITANGLGLFSTTATKFVSAAQANISTVNINTISSGFIEVSTLSSGELSATAVNTDSLSTAQLSLSSLTADYLSTTILDVSKLNVSSLSLDVFAPVNLSTATIDAGVANFLTETVSSLFVESANIDILSVGTFAISEASFSTLSTSYINTVELAAEKLLLSSLNTDFISTSFLQTQGATVSTLSTLVTNTDELYTNALYASTIITNSISTSQLTLLSASIETLTINTVSVATADVDIGDINLLTVSSLIVGDIKDIQQLTISTLQSDLVFASTISTNVIKTKNAFVNTLDANLISSFEITTTSLFVDTGNATTFGTQSLTTNTFNADTAQITTINAETFTLLGGFVSSFSNDTLSSGFVAIDQAVVQSLQVSSISSGIVQSESVFGFEVVGSTIVGGTGQFTNLSIDSFQTSDGFISTLSTSLISSFEIYTGQLIVDTAEVDSLQALTITAVEADIDIITAVQLVADELSTTTISTLNLQAENAAFTTISTASVTLQTAFVSTISTDVLSSLQVQAASIDATNATVGTLNVENVIGASGDFISLVVVSQVVDSLEASGISSVSIYTDDATVVNTFTVEGSAQFNTLTATNVITDSITTSRSDFAVLSSESISTVNLQVESLLVQSGLAEELTVNTLIVESKYVSSMSSIYISSVEIYTGIFGADLADIVSLNATNITVSNLTSGTIVISSVNTANIVTEAVTASTIATDTLSTTNAFVDTISSGLIITGGVEFVDTVLDSTFTLYVSGGILQFTGDGIVQSNLYLSNAYVTDTVLVGVKDPFAYPKTSIRYSTDGESWDNASGGFLYYGTAVAYSPQQSLWVATGYDDTVDRSILYSSNGVEWTSTISGGFETVTNYTYGSAVAWNSTLSLWVAGGYANNPVSTLQYSTDGKNWRGSRSGGFYSSGPTLPEAKGIVAAGNKFYAVGTSGSLAPVPPPRATIQQSTDGSNWTPIASGGFSFLPDVGPPVYEGRGIGYNSTLGVVVAVGVGTTSNETIQRSVNGTTFTSILTGGFLEGEEGGGNTVAWAPAPQNRWVAVGNASSAAGTILRSTDSLNWIPATSGGFEDNGYYQAYGISYSAAQNLWVATGYHQEPGQTIQTSTDGANWTPATSGFGYQTEAGGYAGFGVAFGQNKWVAVGTQDDDQTFNLGYSELTSSNITTTEIYAEYISAGTIVVFGSNTLIVQGGSELANVNVDGELTLNPESVAVLPQIESLNIQTSTVSFVDIETEDAYSLYVSDAVLYFNEAPVLASNLEVETLTATSLFVDYISTADIYTSTVSFVDIEDEQPYSLYVSDSVLYFNEAPVLASNLEVETLTATSLFVDTISTADIYTSTVSFVDIEDEQPYILYVSDSVLYFNEAPVLASNLEVETVTAGSLFVDTISTADIYTSTVSFVDIEDEQPYSMYVSDSVLYFNEFPVVDSNLEVETLTTASLFAEFVSTPELLVSTIAFVDIKTAANYLMYVSNSYLYFNNAAVVAGGGGGSVSSNLAVSNVTTSSLTSGYVSGISAYFSSINGYEFTGSGGGSVSSNLAVSNVTTSSLTSGYVSGISAYFSSINGYEFTGSGGGGSVSSNLAVSNVTTSSLTSGYVSGISAYFSSINGYEFTGSGGGSVSSNLAVSNVTTSSLTSEYVSGISAYFSSINGFEFTGSGGGGSVSSNLVLSNLEVVDTISSGSIYTDFISTADIYTSTVSFVDIETESTFSLYVSDATLYFDNTPVVAGGGSVSSNLAVSNINTSTATVTNSLIVSGYPVANQLQQSVWIAVGSGTQEQTIQSSTDGNNWSSVAVGNGFSTGGQAIGWNGNYWVALGTGNSPTTNTLISTDGNNWSGIATGGFVNYGSGIVWNGSYWVATGNSGSVLSTIQKSTDGNNWSGIVSGGFGGGFGSRGIGIGWNGTYFIAVGTDFSSQLSTIQKSTDGSNWSGIVSGGFTNAGSKVTWNGSYWVAVGNNASALGTIQQSTDGDNWSFITSGGFYNNGGSGIDWNGSYWVAVGEGINKLSSIQTSTDGSNWKGILTGGFSNVGNNTGIGIAWNGSYWVAVGDGSIPQSTIQVSTDGNNWSAILSGGFTSQGVGVVAGSTFTTVYTSTLGTHITGYQVSTQELFVSSINGYEFTGSGGGSLSSNLAVSNVTTSSLTSEYVSGISAYFSSINGYEFTGSGGGSVSSNLAVSNVTTSSIFADYMSTNYLEVSTALFTGNVSINTLSVFGLSTLNVTGAANITTLNAGVFSVATLYVSSLNGADYSGGGGGGSLSSNLAVSNVTTSSLTSEYVSGISAYFSSINGYEFTGSGGGGSVSSNLAVSNIVVSDTTAFTPLTFGNITLDQTNWLSNNQPFQLVCGVYTNNVNIQFLNNGSLVTTFNLASFANQTYSNIAPSGAFDEITLNNVDGVFWSLTNTNGTITDSGQDPYPGGPSDSGTSYVLQTVTGGGEPYPIGTTISPSTIVTSSILVSSINGYEFTGSGGGGGSVSSNLAVSNVTTSTIFVTDTLVLSNSSSNTVTQTIPFWVAGGFGDSMANSIQRSADGVNWSGAESGGFALNASGQELNICTGVAWNGSLWVAVGGYDSQTRTIQISIDGKNWAEINTGGFPAFYAGQGVAWNGSYWVAVGQSGGYTENSIQKSTDGSNWTNMAYDSMSDSGGFSIQGSQVAWNGSYWIAVGADNNPTKSIQSSTDGSNWSQAGSSFTAYGNGIAWNGSYWVAVGNDAQSLNTILKSTDGANWESSQTIGFSPGGGDELGGKGIAWNGQYWLAAGYGTTTGQSILKSTDGLNWSETLNDNFQGATSIAWNGSYWEAAGKANSQNITYTIARSANGDTWTTINSGGFYDTIIDNEIYKGLAIAAGSTLTTVVTSNITGTFITGGQVSTQALFVSSINGQAYTGSGGGGSVSSNLAVSNVTTCNLSVSSNFTLQGSPFPIFDSGSGALLSASWETITFTKTFSSPPRVFTQSYANANINAPSFISVSNILEDQFQARAFTVDNGTNNLTPVDANIYWFAIGT